MINNDIITCNIRPTSPDEPFLLAADLDGTLLGDEEGEARFKAFVQAYSSSFYLAFVTGRPLQSVKELIREKRLPECDYISSSVGTELFSYKNTANTKNQKYAAQVSGEWDIEIIYTLGQGEGIRRQEFEYGQPPFQAGFYWDGQQESLAAFYKRLEKIKGCRILPSSRTYIDVFPDCMGKGEVVRFLLKELKLDPARIVVAGDSGNDKEMFETGFKGIIPCNATDELKLTACELWHYQSPFPGAHGVLDGLCYYGFVHVSGNR